MVNAKTKYEFRYYRKIMNYILGLPVGIMFTFVTIRLLILLPVSETVFLGILVGLIFYVFIGNLTLLLIMLLSIGFGEGMLYDEFVYIKLNKKHHIKYEHIANVEISYFKPFITFPKIISGTYLIVTITKYDKSRIKFRTVPNYIVDGNESLLEDFFKALHKEWSEKVKN